MSSREAILAQIRQNKPAALPLPETFRVNREEENLPEKYTGILQSIGGRVTRVDSLQPVQQYLQQLVNGGAEVVNGMSELLPCNLDQYTGKEATEVEAVYAFFLKGELAVAENGAVWLSEKSMGNRLLPFICQELILVVEAKDIVADLHLAYQIIETDRDGYGVFIAGPSKTADIEQSLVIGAHGPLALQVFILG